MKRFRISTLMLLIVIAALVVALIAEKRRSARLLAEAQARQAEARMAAEVARYHEQIARDQAAASIPTTNAATSGATPTSPPSQ